MNVSQCFVSIHTDNHDQMLAFYRDVVALPPNPAGGPFAFAAGPGSTLSIGLHDDTHGPSTDPSRWIVSLFVDDVLAERQRIEGHGVSFIRKEGVEFWGGVISTFPDPDGNLLQIIQIKPELMRPED